MNNIAVLVHEKADHPKDYTIIALDKIQDMNEQYDNIYIGDVIDYIDTANILDLLVHLTTKLTDNGHIHIKAPDLLQLCWYASRMNIDLAKIRYVLYDTGRRHCYTMDEIAFMLNQIQNISIVNACYVNGYEYSLTIQKI